MSLFPFIKGPTGRYIVIDASGRLVANGDAGASGFIFGYGDTGRAMVVDASGRIILSALSEGITGGSGPGAPSSGSAVGAGTANRLAKYTSPTNLDDSNISENGSALAPINNNIIDLGATATRYKNLFAASGNLTTGLQAGPFVLGAARLDPIITNTTDIGKSDKIIRNIFAASGNLSTGAQIGPIVIGAARIDPIITAVTDIGKATKTFGTLFAASGNFTNGIKLGAGSTHLNQNGILSTTAFTLKTNSVARMTTDSTGNTGFGITTPSGIVHVHGSLISRVHSNVIQKFNTTSGNITFNLNLNNIFHLPLNGNANLTLSSPMMGAKYTFIFKNTNGGGKGLSWPATLRWRDSTALSNLTVTSGVYDVVTCIYDSIDNIFLADFGLEFSA